MLQKVIERCSVTCLQTNRKLFQAFYKQILQPVSVHQHKKNRINQLFLFVRLLGNTQDRKVFFYTDAKPKIAFTHVHRDPRTPQKKKIQIIRKGVLNTKEENRLSGLKILPEIKEDAFPVLPHGDLVRQKMLRKKFKCITNEILKIALNQFIGITSENG